MADPHRELEHLRKLAAANPTKRFGKLLKIIRQDAFLQMVWQKVRTNKGSRTPGVDGHTKDDVDDHVLHDLAHDLASRHYRPQPVRRTYIPKRGKPGQWRGLGIPAIRDRIVQAAIAQVLEALYEPLFRSCSYGFRPGRSPIHALRHVARAYRSGVTWIVEGDLERCFDSVGPGATHQMALCGLSSATPSGRVARCSHGVDGMALASRMQRGVACPVLRALGGDVPP